MASLYLTLNRLIYIYILKSLKSDTKLITKKNIFIFTINTISYHICGKIILKLVVLNELLVI